MDFYAEGVGWVPGDPSVAIAENSADAGFGHEPPDMVIMHFDLIRFQHQYHWLQGIGIVRSINVNEEGTTDGMSLEARDDRRGTACRRRSRARRYAT